MRFGTKKNEAIVLVLLNKNKEKIRQQKISEFKVKEDYILKESIEKFDNDSPCIIIRTKIMNSVFSELNVYLKECKMAEQNTINVNDLREKFQECIEFEDDIYEIAI